LGRRRIRLFHKLEVKYFSFYVVTEKKHEREIETLLIHAAGVSCETVAWLFKTTAPLTRDIVKAVMTSCRRRQFSDEKRTVIATRVPDAVGRYQPIVTFP
jgi:hypothetical protein